MGDANKLRWIHPEANKAHASGPVVSVGFFQCPVPNFVFVILYSFS